MSNFIIPLHGWQNKAAASMFPRQQIQHRRKPCSDPAGSCGPPRWQQSSRRPRLPAPRRRSHEARGMPLATAASCTDATKISLSSADSTVTPPSKPMANLKGYGSPAPSSSVSACLTEPKNSLWVQRKNKQRTSSCSKASSRLRIPGARWCHAPAAMSGGGAFQVDANPGRDRCDGRRPLRLVLAGSLAHHAHSASDAFGGNTRFASVTKLALRYQPRTSTACMGSVYSRTSTIFISRSTNNR